MAVTDITYTVKTGQQLYTYTELCTMVRGYYICIPYFGIAAAL